MFHFESITKGAHVCINFEFPSQVPAIAKYGCRHIGDD